MDSLKKVIKIDAADISFPRWKKIMLQLYFKECTEYTFSM